MKKKKLITVGIATGMCALLIGGFTLAVSGNKAYQTTGEAKEPVEKLVVIEEEQVPLAADFQAVTATKSPEVSEGDDMLQAPEETEKVPVVQAEDTVEKVSVIPKEENHEETAGESAESVAEDKPLTELGNGIYGYYDEAAAEVLLSKVNDIRNGMAPMLSAQLNEIAKARALACVSDFSHNGMQTNGECLAKDQKDAQTVVSAWNGSSFHYDMMRDAAYTQGGAACIWYDAGNGQMKSIWVVVMN